jgi:hypothetical protein
MRLGLVERGMYKTVEYDDLTGYGLEVNGFNYDFGHILQETRRRVAQLWGFDCPPDLLRQRLHFSEEAFFNRMVKNEHYGVYSKHTGAHVCLGLVGQAETCNLVIHELAHEIHFRQGFYIGTDDYVRETCAIMAEEEFGKRRFDWNPHFTSQHLLHQLMDLPAFGRRPFRERWDTLSRLRSVEELSYLINIYLDDYDGGKFRHWLERQLPNIEQARPLYATLAGTTLEYALYNRRLLFNRLCELRYNNMTSARMSEIQHALRHLKKLDQTNPDEKLASLIDAAFVNL